MRGYKNIVSIKNNNIINIQEQLVHVIEEEEDALTSSSADEFMNTTAPPPT